MTRWKVHPLEMCGGKHTNGTLEYHECICNFDFKRQKHYLQTLKYKHCLLADEMRKIENFELYVIIAVVVGVVLIFGVAAFCSCKWYFQTNDNPCGCLSCGKKKKKKKSENTSIEGEPPPNIAQENGRQAWTPIRVVPYKDSLDGTLDSRCETLDTVSNESPGFCMNFCLSDPVQDCCEFFDCDIMWRKKNIYTIPMFGRRKQPPLQRRPTRPAPPPPKPSVSVPPMMKYPEPMHIGYDDDVECEPVPEAPPSPEPVRVEQPRAMYVDPLAFLQRPFLKSTKEKSVEEEPEALYSKMKGFVFGKAKKSSSIVSLNKLGVSPNPDTVSNTSSKKSKYSRTGSLASLHNLSDEQLDASYHNKRSMSLASLHMVEEEPTKRMAPKALGNKLLMARSRGSLHNICEDDIPPSMRTDEYIDLEEMSKRIEAKMQAANDGTLGKNSPRPPAYSDGSGVPDPSSHSVVGSGSWTPNFVPASVYGSPQMTTDGAPLPYPLSLHQMSSPGHQHRAPLGFESPYGSSSSFRSGEESANSKYFPPVPATPERPAVPARIAIGSPVVNSGTLGRPKPAVPPRPPGSGSNSPKPRAPQPPTLGRSSHIVKPSAPPPPPPVTTPIESSL
ncbi:formin-like protein 20 [Homarus americanus]|uniref:Putative Nascent polypeptide-associated complex subunit alpha-like 2 n=1 Tax=Homarus americanus TaxID=6706 RepID=A0A8J5MQ01_HOMAM|nr:formin-like protein 20 [Homarus americanus]KAG7159518.1 putative Nascent polypeptide-associated complex subunit alpha-like 2 [Homarus americanus]